MSNLCRRCRKPDFEEIGFDKHVDYARSLSVFACMKYCPKCNIKAICCNLCGDIFSNTKHASYIIMIHYTNYHMEPQYGISGCFSIKAGHVHSQIPGMRFIFPQLLFVKSTNGNKFPHSEYNSDMVANKDVDVISILDGKTDLIGKNRVDVSYYGEYVISEVKKSNYYCVGCLVVYEDGLPPIDLVVNHIQSCVPFIRSG